MTISSELSRSGPYTGNGVTVSFGYGFKVYDATHLKVVRREASLDTVITTGFTVTGVGAASGTIEFAVPPTAAQTITIIRNVPKTQDVDLVNQGAFFAEVIERSFDLSTMLIQQLNEEIARSVKVSVGDTTDPATLIASLQAQSAAAVAAAASAAASAAAAQTFNPASYQPVNANLTSISGQALTAFALSLLDDTTSLAARNTIEVGLRYSTSITVSGSTFADFAIPTGVKRILVIFNDISTNAAATISVVIGPGTTPEVTGYQVSLATIISASASMTEGVIRFPVGNIGVAADFLSGTLVLESFGGSGVTWIVKGSSYQRGGSTAAQNMLSGSKVLAGTIGVLRFQCSAGSFDLGNVNVAWEF